MRVPCAAGGSVALSSELGAAAQLLLVSDATLGEYGWYGNTWYGQPATTSMIELGTWLGTSNISGGAGGADGGIPSLHVADLLVAAGAAANASRLADLSFLVPSANVVARDDFATPPEWSVEARDKRVALVVVSCASDYTNQGFLARVRENRARYLEPLLASWRRVGAGAVIHALNGHRPDGACAPRAGEHTPTHNDDFDALLTKLNVKTLYYVGYAANTDMSFGVGGMQRFYSRRRYLRVATPAYYWVDEATVGLENAATLQNEWAKKAALAYRQPLLRASRPYYANIVTSASLRAAICAAAPDASGGSILYELEGMHNFKSASNAIEDDEVHGGCGRPPLIGPSAITISIDAVPDSIAAADRKLLCLVKDVGTPFAAYQLRTGGAGELLYQTANGSGWSGTLSVPRFFTSAKQTVRVHVVHDGAAVSIFRNGTLVAHEAHFAALEYSHVAKLWVGKRVDAESWLGQLGNVRIRTGSWPPRPPSNASTGLPATELAALADIYKACGGATWRFRAGTDAVGGGAAWRPGALAGEGGDPCFDGWYGVKCNADGSHVTQLFPNTRFSGNPLVCELPRSISQLSMLEHLYTSNDASPSSLHGLIPSALGQLSHLKCLYLSHNQLSGEIPTELAKLTKLQVFLARCNQLSGPLLDFSGLTDLRNVWFDTNQLSGSLVALGKLPHLTFLQASNNKGISGALPPALCGIECFASGTNTSCAATLPKNCCNIPHCGAAPAVPPPPKPSMGECFPQ